MPLTQFNLPVPKGTRVSSEYGPRTISKNDHKGIDFEVSVGTKVTSAASGRVIRIIPGHGEFGNVVVVQHGDDQATLYAHLSRIDVTIGQDLAETSQIGLSGNTGRSKGSHLHFEIIEGSSNIAAIRNAQEIGLPGVGIGGAAGRANPRQFFDHYTDTEFQTLVSADKSGKDLLTGDKRKNRMVGNDNDNNLEVWQVLTLMSLDLVIL
jgi:murein DD-endopeptidase MepM/ murein hydrolase activator NlpD